MCWYSKKLDLVLKQCGEGGLVNRGRGVGGMNVTVPLFENLKKVMFCLIATFYTNFSPILAKKN